MLKIRFKNNKYNAVWLVEPKVSIGRALTNDFVVDDAQVADNHLEVLVEHEELTLKNLMPEMPVKVNDEEVISICTLRPDDVISIGNVELQVVDPKREPKESIIEASNATQLRATPAGVKNTGWAIKANHAALANRVFAIKEMTTIGRANECDISLSASHLSRRHAQLQVLDGLLYVKDLGSANGTYLNGKKITEARVSRGDELRFDTLSFGVLGPADELAKTSIRSPSAKVSDISNVTPKPPSRPSPKSKDEFDEPEEVKAPKPHPSVHARASKMHDPEPPKHGKQGLAILVIIALVVLAALYFTRS